MAEKLNKVALFIVLLVVIALIFGQLGFTKQQTGNSAQASITVGNPTPSARSSLTVLKTAPVFFYPMGTAYSVLTVQPQK